MRPVSIKEVSERLTGYDDMELYIVVGNFLDKFYLSSKKSGDKNKLVEMIKDEPDIQEHFRRHWGPYLAATAHKLARDYDLEVPRWVFKSEYYLRRTPWFSVDTQTAYRMILLIYSPVEFKVRNLYVPDNVLSRM